MIIYIYAAVVTYLLVGMALANAGKDLRGRSASWSDQGLKMTLKWAVAWPWGLARWSGFNVKKLLKNK